MRPGWLLDLKTNVRAGDIGSRQLRCLQALDFFFARSGLRGTRAGREARDEFIQLRNFLFALGIFGFDARANGSFREHHIVVAAVVHDHGLVVDVGGVGADAVQKMAVVRDHDQHAFVLAKIVLQPVDGIEVQVVGRLVEQQRRRDCRKALARAGRELSGRPAIRPSCVRAGIRSTLEAIEQHRGVGFRGVAAFFADDSFEFAEAHAIRVRELFVGLGVERVALLEGLPQRRVAHDDGVDDAKLVEGKLVLAQNAKLFWAADRAFGRLQFAGENFHQRGFAGAIRAGDGVAAPREEGAGDVLEQDSGAEAHRDVVESDQALKSYRKISARGGWYKPLETWRNLAHARH